MADRIPSIEIDTLPGINACAKACADKIQTDNSQAEKLRLSRRSFFTGSAGYSAAAILGASALMTGCDDSASQVSWAEHFQKHYRLMSDAEKTEAIARLEKRYSAEYGKAVSVSTQNAQENVLFGAALNLQKCIGCRRCAKACSIENNQTRAAGEEIEWIRVLEMEKSSYAEQAGKQSDNNPLMQGEYAHKPAGIRLEGDYNYQPEKVPEATNHYMPISCMQCENPPCVKVCPVQATYREPDGIVVIDYNWCIGCRMCMQACPYGARHFNWHRPTLANEEMNPETHYLGNRPRMKGVVEKCTFCIQRVRKGRYPACVEVCPVGARKFGNLLDENSEVRKVLASKRVFRLKEELNTSPKFFYFMD